MTNARWQNTGRIATLRDVLLTLCAPVPGAGWYIPIPEKSEEYVKAEELADVEKYEEALPFFEAGAEKGDVWSIISLGIYYNNGLGGLPKDGARALSLVKKAAVILNCPYA